MQTQKIFNNRYRVDGILGNGGMANVYVGTDTLLRRRVAIKTMPGRCWLSSTLHKSLGLSSVSDCE